MHTSRVNYTRARPSGGADRADAAAAARRAREGAAQLHPLMAPTSFHALVPSPPTLLTPTSTSTFSAPHRPPTHPTLLWRPPPRRACSCTTSRPRPPPRSRRSTADTMSAARAQARSSVIRESRSVRFYESSARVLCNYRTMSVPQVESVHVCQKTGAPGRGAEDSGRPPAVLGSCQLPPGGLRLVESDPLVGLRLGPRGGSQVAAPSRDLRNPGLSFYRNGRPLGSVSTNYAALSAHASRTTTRTTFHHTSRQACCRVQ